MKIVVNRRNAPDDLIASTRKKKLDDCMLVKRVLRCVDELVHIALERRHPERIIPV
jgi:hypothetical protein